MDRALNVRYAILDKIRMGTPTRHHARLHPTGKAHLEQTSAEHSRINIHKRKTAAKNDTAIQKKLKRSARPEFAGDGMNRACFAGPSCWREELAARTPMLNKFNIDRQQWLALARILVPQE
jgi:hypothetical protein